MGTIRSVKTKNFSVISNVILTDKRLSWEARGVAAYLLSKPDGWTCRVPHLMQAGNTGRDRVYRILTELEGAGYLERRTTRKPDGTFDYEQILHEEPVTGQPVPDKPDSVNQEPIVNTDSVNTDRSNTKINNTGAVFLHRFPERMALTEERRDVAREHGVREYEIEREWKKYASHYRGMGTKAANWDALWVKWCASYRPPSPGSAHPLPPQRSKGMEQARHNMEWAVREDAEDEQARHDQAYDLHQGQLEPPNNGRGDRSDLDTDNVGRGLPDRHSSRR